MTDLTVSGIISSDSWIEHRHGRLFARSWRPAADTGQGTKAPIVLFHDSLGCVDLWRDFPERLSAVSGRTVIAYDRLGFGRSDAHPGTLAMDFVADEARTYFPALREQLGVDRFVAFGHSVGGGMAVNCAALYADACEALITESAQVFPEDRTLQAIAAAKEQFRDGMQLERLRKYHGDKAKWVLDAWTDSWLDPRFASWSLAAVLPSVSCSVLACHGAHDEYGSEVHPQMIGQLSRGPSRVELIADTYHVPHRERPEVVFELVSGFLGPLEHASGRNDR